MPTDPRSAILFRYDNDIDNQLFIRRFGEDFTVLSCGSDEQALGLVAEQGSTLCAVFVDLNDTRKALASPVFEAVSQRYPQCLKVLLHDSIALDEVIDLLDRRVIDKCFAKPYDTNLIRSHVLTAGMALRETARAALPVADEAARPCVLIVDDEQSATKYLKKQLDRLQDRFDVLCAANGQEALEILQHRDRIAVVMTDQRMPGMKGQQLLNELRQTYPHIVRILTSAYGEVDVALGAVNDGKIFRYQKKPWDARELLQCLDAALAESEAITRMHRQAHTGYDQDFDRIRQQRKAGLLSALSGTVDGVAGPGALQRFLDDLERIGVLPPNASHIRASTDTDIEAQLVNGFRDDVARRLARLPDELARQGRDWAGAVADTLPAVVCGDAGGDTAREGRASQEEGAPAARICEQLLDALDLLVSSSGLVRSDLSVHTNGSGLQLGCTADKPLKMYSHLMAPLTKVSQPLLQQQSALLLLYVVARSLGGTVELTGGHQAYVFSMRIPAPA